MGYALVFPGQGSQYVGMGRAMAEAYPEAARIIARADEAGSGRMMTPALTHQQIADMVGTSRETVTRAIKQLKESGWLAQDGKRYVVPSDPH